ncbi:hypothetical protein C4K23_6022 [Pseudomonas chlororaphis]|nr:hypothetical protein C4K23_6022 [Pseudomonas chlororaphis]
MHTTPTLVVNPFRPVDNSSAGRCICHKSLRYNDSSEIFVAYLCLYLPWARHKAGENRCCADASPRDLWP